MWQHRHTATIILLLATGTARADFTESVWNDYFAVPQMAAECHSGRVERCAAVGVAVDSPSWWDYLTGKNRAKLVSVKTDIKKTYSYFVNPQLADTNRSYLPYLATGDLARLTWTNEAQFLTDIGLPTNALDETPYFKTQYTSTPGGWHTARICLSNMIVMRAAVDWHPNVWTNLRTVEDGWGTFEYSSLPVIRVAGPGWFGGPLRLLDIYPTWEFAPYYGFNALPPLYPALPKSLNYIDSECYPTNARGAWTTYADETTWATTWALATAGWVKALTNGAADWAPADPLQSDYGMDNTHAFTPYAVKTLPKAVLGGVCVLYSNVTYTVLTNEVTVTVTNYTATNTVYDYDYESGTITVWVTNVVTNVLSHIETNGYATVTNYVTTNIPDARVTGYVAVALYDTNTIAAFGTRFIGATWGADNTIYSWGTVFTTNDIVVTNAVVTNAPVLTNVIDSIEYVTNTVEDEISIVTTNLIIIGTNYVADTNSAVTSIQTNKVEEVVTNIVAGLTRYAAGATQIDGVPYVGTTPYYLTKGQSKYSPGVGYWVDPVYPGTNLYGMIPLYTGAAHIVDIYYQWVTPSNFPPIMLDATWHGYYQTYSNEHLTTDARYADFATAGAAGWVRDAGTEKVADIVWGDKVYGTAIYAVQSLTVLSFEAMKSVYDTEFPSAPGANSVNLVGREATNAFAAVWWNGTNGFNYK